jgi:hypothetical protein
MTTLSPPSPADGIVGSDGQPWYCSMDAMAWAKAFVAIDPHAEVGGGISFTEEAMVGWFANAIMTGYDEARRRIGRGELSPELPFDLSASVPPQS